MKNKIIGYYSVFLGVSIVGMWAFILSKEAIPEGKTAFTFHLLSEFLMVSVCLISGIFLIKNHKHAIKLNVIGHAMIIYSVLNGAGYYAERSEIAMTVMFVVLFLISGIIISYLTLFPFLRSDGA